MSANIKILFLNKAYLKKNFTMIIFFYLKYNSTNYFLLIFEVNQESFSV
jgi:hypothetical protein